ncbi:MAG TPA: hypothetical protein VNJ01_15640 [Bacteriovoracaceae bacterium]|nr:hypothetical protein [Bacteriovoracaceae bacterium]
MKILFALLLISAAITTSADVTFHMRCDSDYCSISGRELRENRDRVQRGEEPLQYQQCHSEMKEQPQYGHQLSFHLSIRGNHDGSVTLKYINGSSHYTYQPQISVCGENNEPCSGQQVQEQQVASQQFVTEESNLKFQKINEVEKYIMREFCTGSWSSGLRYIDNLLPR